MNFIEARISAIDCNCDRPGHELAAMDVGEVPDNHVI
jgi:hypothetical protein